MWKKKPSLGVIRSADLQSTRSTFSNGPIYGNYNIIINNTPENNTKTAKRKSYKYQGTICVGRYEKRLLWVVKWRELVVKLFVHHSDFRSAFSFSVDKTMIWRRNHIMTWAFSICAIGKHVFSPAPLYSSLAAALG